MRGIIDGIIDASQIDDKIRGIPSKVGGSYRSKSQGWDKMGTIIIGGKI